MNQNKKKLGKNRNNRVENIINEDIKNFVEIKKSKQSKFIKNMAIKIQDSDDYKNKINLDDLGIFCCV